MSKMLSPKELLAGESAGINLTFKALEGKSFDDDESQGDDSDESSEHEDSDDNENSSDEDEHAGSSNARSSNVRSVDKSDQVTGKEGWLYRENDPALKSTEAYTKIWVSICGHRLMFSKDSGGSNGAFSLFEATRKARNTCFGYLDLVSTSDVKKQMPRKGKKIQFTVRDGECSVTFGADTEAEREEWIEVIRESIKGVLHFLPISALELPDGAMGSVLDTSSRDSHSHVGKGDVRRSMMPAAIDFPSKSGYLKKTSQGKGTFAVSVVKKRWFRLAAGELRYYEDEDESATKLKECIVLEGASVLPPAGTSTSALCLVHVQFAGGRAMKLEASTPKVATEWRDAFSQTIAILVNMPSSRSANAPLKPVRRLNIHDNATDKTSTLGHGEGLRSASPLSALSSPAGTNTSSAPASSAPARRTRAQTQVSFSPKRNTAEEYEGSDDGAAEQIVESLSQSFWGSWGGGASAKNSPAAPSASPAAGPGKLTRAQSAHVSSPTIAGSDYRPKFAQRTPGSTLKSTDTVELLKNCLSQNFLVKRLPELNPLIELMEEKIAVPGEVIIWQGSSGDAFYALESGQCDVLKDGRAVSKIQAGKTFGDLALVNNATRQATIRATQVCKLWLFTRNQFRDLAVKQELEQIEERVQFLQQIQLFSKLVRTSLEKIAEVMVLKSYNTGERIIKQGDTGDAFYMIVSGRAVVTQTTTFGSSAGTELARLGPGMSFGELALIEDAPRKASVTASCACKCWTVDRHSFKSLFGSMDEAVNESIGVSMLQKVRILEALTDRQLQVVARCLVSTKYLEGEVIIKQGDVGDSFYLIAEGEVSVQVNHIQVATLEGGSFFGEMSLLSNEKRSATVTAIKDTSCLVLSRNDFNEHLGTIEEVNEEARRRKEAASRPRGDAGSGRFLSSLRRVSGSFFSASPTSSPTQSLARAKSMGNVKGTNALFSTTNAMFELSSLERVKKIGSGTFGTVFLVQHIMSNKLYAMKVLHKQHLKDKCQEDYVYSERDIMLTLVESQYVAALYATLQDAKSIYLVMQYVPGGDLWNLLYKCTTMKRSREGGIPLSAALFYIANVLVAINHIHNQDIVYRNIKPENLVVDGTGYLKIVDFGSAKRLTVGQKTNTLCGAAEYIAPEMVLSKGYNKAVDFWAIGVLMFELLTRTSPFAHSNLSMVYQNIMDSEGVVKALFSSSCASLDAQAKDVISNLLLFIPNRRLGMRHDGMKDIWAHPAFAQLSQEKIETKSVKAPLLPDTDEHHLAATTDEDVLDVLEDEDEIPAYKGNFDYRDF